MDAKEASERDRIIEEATRWYVANREADAESSSDEFLAWLRASPEHVREYLGVSAVARDLPSASNLETLWKCLPKITAARDLPSASNNLDKLMRTFMRLKSGGASELTVRRRR